MPERGEPPAMRWWGWGEAGHPPTLTAHALELLGRMAAIASAPRPPVALGAVRLPPPALPAALLERLQRVVGRSGVRIDHAERVRHAAGKGYADLVRMRAGAPAGAPDAVVLPSSHQQVRELLQLSAHASLAVVPFGGGTSVVGGVAPLAGAHRGVLALDMGRLGGVLALDGESATVTVQAGIRAPALERFLAPRGFTLGHFPQSFHYVSLGGCAATRSAGQASTGYGSIAQMVLGLRLAAPAGDLALPALPASAAGPSLRALLVGSEGTLGVISELSLRLRPAPRERHYAGLFFESFDAGVQALRALAREQALPDVARLSDEQETRTTLALAGGGPRAYAGRAYLRARGYRGGCLAIVGFEGTRAQVACRRQRALALLRKAGALALGRAPGEAWLRSRFEGPYMRDELLDHGVMVETLETAAQWSQLRPLHREITRAIEGALAACGTPGLVFCHLSHLYETGASLYFTFIAQQRRGEEIGQWRAVKEAASRAIVAGKGTITHHHAVGCDHAPWMAQEVGARGLAALAALKAELDPGAIMNPGKLLALSPPG